MAVFRSASMLKTTAAVMASSGCLELTSWASSWAVSPASFLYLRSSCPPEAASAADDSLVFASMVGCPYFLFQKLLQSCAGSGVGFGFVVNGDG